MNMLVKAELLVKIEPQLTPGGLGGQRGVPGVWGKAKIDGWEERVPFPGEVKEFHLTVLQGKACSSHEAKDNRVSNLQYSEIH